jgi:hypothetical protein
MSMQAAVSLRASNFGKAASTTALRKSGISSFNRYQEKKDDPQLAAIGEKYVEADNLQNVLTDFAEWYSETKVLQENGTGKFLEASTKAKYWSNVKEALKQRFPKHDAWQDEQWVKDIQHGMVNIAKRMEYDQGTDSQDDNIRPLYREVKAEYVRFNERKDADWGTRQGRDLHSITSIMIKKATRENKNYTKRIISLTAFLGVGRGGEPKFLRIDENVWDSMFEHYSTMWRQRKLLKKTSLTFGSNPPGGDFETDNYHAFSCYFAVDDGLYRADGEEQIARFMFPSLHGVNDAAVSKLLTKWLRDFSDKRYFKSTTAKSLRKGANNYLAMQNGIGISKEMRLVRGCWAPSDTSDKPAYRDVNAAITYPPFCALAGWTNPNNMYNLPMRIPDTLPPDDLQKIRSFHNRLYVISKDKLKGLDWDIFLTPFLWTCTAAAILYFPDMLRKYGQFNPMTDKMLRVMVDAKITASTSDGISLLHKWSDAILVDFKDRNNHTSQQITHENLVATVTKQSQMLQEYQVHLKQQSTMMAQLLSQLQDNASEKAVMLEAVNNLSFEVCCLRQGKRKFDEVSSECGDGDGKDINNEGAKTDRTNTNNDDVGGDKTPDKTPAASRPTKMMQLAYGARAKAIGEGTGKSMTLASILQDLYRDKQLERKKGNMALMQSNQFDSSNQSKFKAAMELIDRSWTLEQKTKLTACNAEMSDKDLADVTSQVEKLAMQNLAKFKNGPNAEVGRLKPYVLGVGANYIKVKKDGVKTQPVSIVTPPAKRQSSVVGGVISMVGKIFSPSRRNRDE